jgi:alkanesulfonate monooxygenase SsuD/methylene tetrahydromethanopterin reductase-like flavin-dependent oxidoreductase (luciferase family)
MRFGVGFFTAQQPPGYKRSYADIYADMLEHARLMDQAGLDSFWVTEHHFCDDGYLPSPTTICAAVAAATKRLTLGCGVMAPFAHPLRLAEDLIGVDLISGGGRLIAQIGAGYKVEEFQGFSVDRDTRIERLLETVQILRGAFSGQPFHFNGVHYQVPELTVIPGPSTPGGPPLMLAGNSLEAAERSGRLGTLYKVDPSDSWEDAVRFVEAYDAASPAGSEDREIHVQVYGFVSTGDPWAEVVDGMVYMREAYDRWGWAPARPASRDPKDYRLLLGNPDQVAEQVEAYRSQFGDRTHLTLRLSYPGMDPKVVANGIKLWGQVADRFRRNEP